MRKICEQCGGLFETKERKQKYCSSSCFGKDQGFKKGHTPWNKGMKGFQAGKEHAGWKGGPGIVKCQWCGKEFEVKHARIDKAKYCSRKCFHKARSEQMSGSNSSFWKGGITTYKRKLFLNERRRARKINAEGSHTQGEWELLKKQYGYRCPACGEREPFVNQRTKHLTEDHIIPLIKGGSDYIENIQPLCFNCNVAKHTKVIKYQNG